MLKWDKRYISSRFAGRFGRIRSLDYGKGFSKWAAGHIMVILKSSRWSVRQERSSSQAKANFETDSKHIFVDVTWDLAPIDFIYCIGKKNIHSFNKGYFEGINSPLDGKASSHWISQETRKLWGFEQGFQSRQITFELKHFVRLPGFLPLRACWLISDFYEKWCYWKSLVRSDRSNV